MLMIFTTGIAMGYYGLYYTYFSNSYSNNSQVSIDDHDMMYNNDNNNSFTIVDTILSTSHLQDANKNKNTTTVVINAIQSNNVPSSSPVAAAKQQHHHHDHNYYHWKKKYQSIMEQYQLYIDMSDIKISQLQNQLSVLDKELDVATNVIQQQHQHHQYQQQQTTDVSSLLLTNYIQRRENVLCRQWFQHDGPYHVEFRVMVGRDDVDTTILGDDLSLSSSFVIEISSKARHYLPHTVFTFLNLVESMTYSNSQMSFVGFSNDEKVLEISSTTFGDDGDNSIMPYLTSLGYYPTTTTTTTTTDDVGRHTGGVLAFLEKPLSDDRLLADDFRCDQYSIGFIQHGPSLKLFLGNDAEWGDDGSNSICFGRVVKGHDTTLRAIKEYVINQRKQLQINTISYIPPHE
jgi:hypothetical protein